MAEPGNNLWPVLHESSVKVLGFAHQKKNINAAKGGRSHCETRVQTAQFVRSQGQQRKADMEINPLRPKITRYNPVRIVETDHHSLQLTVQRTTNSGRQSAFGDGKADGRTVAGKSASESQPWLREKKHGHNPVKPGNNRLGRRTHET